jgi:fibronectin-binding autotransporter adhesin
MKKVSCYLSWAAAWAVVACAADSAWAATIAWQSNDTTLGDTLIWSNANNWVGGVSPVAGDDVSIGIPVAGGSRITTNDLPAGTQVNGIAMTANLNEVNGNSINLGGNVSYTAGGTSIGKIGAPVVLLQDTTYSNVANTSNGRLEVGGGISGNFGIVKDGAGRLRFVGTAKAYTGSTTVIGGLLDVSATDMLPFGAGKGDLYIGTGAQLAINNVNTQINALNDYLATSGAVNKTGSNTRNLTLGNGDASGSFAGAMTFTGGNSSIVKVGTGTQTLGGTLAFAGPAAVNGGRLNLNGTLAGGVVVGASGTLGGSGTINPIGAATNGNQLVQVNGTIAPGTSPSTLTINGPVAFGTAAILNYELNGGDATIGGGINDLITGVTTLTLDGVLNVSETVPFSFATAPVGSTWRLLNYSGALTDNGLVLGTVPVLSVGKLLTIDTSVAGQVDLRLTAVVPEPATWLLGMLGLVAVAVRRRS